MNLQTIIIWHFRFWGLFPFSPNGNRILSTVLIIWTIFHLFLLATVCYLVNLFAKDIFFEDDITAQFIDICQLIAPFLAHFVILLDSLFSVQNRIGIFERYRQINFKFMALNIDVEFYQKRSILRYFLRSSFIIVVSLWIDIWLLVTVYANRQWFYHIVTSNYSIFSCRFCRFFYIFIVDLLECRIDLLNKQLIHIGNLYQMKYLTMKQASIKFQLKILKDIYTDLWKVRDLIELSFGWSMLATMTADFVHATVNLYWNYVGFYFGPNPFWKQMLIALVPTFLTLAFLFYSCEMCSSSVCSFLIAN